jgi:ATP-binding cassette subfamily F protein uup
MDKVVDHLLVFHGNGDIQDFPGNYTQYREYVNSKPRDEEKTVKKQKTDNQRQQKNENVVKTKLTYKEKREMEQLEKDIEALEAEQKRLEEELCSGTLSVEDLTAKSIRLPKLKEELDAKSLRWLELSEYDG